MCFVYHIYHLISTHTLTWSVTLSYLYTPADSHDFNSHAHVERDNSALTDLTGFVNFNSHAHVERDAA